MDMSPPEEDAWSSRGLAGSVRISVVASPPLEDVWTRYASAVLGTSITTDPPLEAAATRCGGATNDRETSPPLDAASTEAPTSPRTAMSPPLERTRRRSTVAPPIRTSPPEDERSTLLLTSETLMSPPLLAA